MMKSKILLSVAAAILVLPCLTTTIQADVTDYGDKWYYVGAPQNPASNYDPTDPATEADDWNGLFTPLPVPPGTRVGPDSVLVVAMRNDDSILVKTVTLTIDYVGDSLARRRIGHGSTKYVTKHGEPRTERDGPHPTIPLMRQYYLVFDILYQPDWEWIEVWDPESRALNVHNATIHSVCTKVPSLTPYGIMLLVLLLAGTAVWVMRKRKAVVSI